MQNNETDESFSDVVRSSRLSVERPSFESRGVFARQAQFRTRKIKKRITSELKRWAVAFIILNIFLIGFGFYRFIWDLSDVIKIADIKHDKALAEAQKARHQRQHNETTGPPSNNTHQAHDFIDLHVTINPLVEAKKNSSLANILARTGTFFGFRMSFALCCVIVGTIGVTGSSFSFCVEHRRRIDIRKKVRYETVRLSLLEIYLILIFGMVIFAVAISVVTGRNMFLELFFLDDTTQWSYDFILNIIESGFIFTTMFIVTILYIRKLNIEYQADCVFLAKGEEEERSMVGMEEAARREPNSLSMDAPPSSSQRTDIPDAFV